MVANEQIVTGVERSRRESYRQVSVLGISLCRVSCASCVRRGRSQLVFGPWVFRFSVAPFWLTLAAYFI